MERHDAPFERIKDVKDYFDFIQRNQDGLDEEHLLRTSVPDHFRLRFLTHITKSMVLGCDLFSACDSGFIRCIIMSLEQHFYCTQVFIMTTMAPIDGMYFVKRGTVDLLKEGRNENYRMIKKVKPDESFGEECLLYQMEKNPYMARAATDCELWFLSRKTFVRLLKENPQVYSSLLKKKEESFLVTRRTSSISLNKLSGEEMSETFFIHPSNYLVQLWFCLILVVNLYYLIVTPFRVTFMENYDINKGWMIFDYTCDCVFLV